MGNHSSMTQEYYIGTLEQIQAVDAKMCENCGVPNDTGTINMVNPIQTAIPLVYAAPVVEWWNGFTKEQVNAGIVCAKSIDVQFPEVESE